MVTLELASFFSSVPSSADSLVSSASFVSCPLLSSGVTLLASEIAAPLALSGAFDSSVADETSASGAAWVFSETASEFSFVSEET